MKRSHWIILFFLLSFEDPKNKTPLPFMPAFFSSFPNVRDIAISAAGDEMYFTAESFKKEFAAIMVSKKMNKIWSEPKVASFSGQYKDLEPALSPDGLTLWFASARPIIKNSTEPKDIDLWFVTRRNLNEPWSHPVNAGSVINTSKDEFFPSVAESGNVYFTRFSDSAKRKEDIYRSIKTMAGYSKPEPLPVAINADFYEYNAFVAPDESYLIFSSYGRKDDMGGSDLYISFKNGDEWKNAVHLGASINSKKIDYCPFVDVKNKRLYFTSERNNVPEYYSKPQNKHSLLKSFNTVINGTSRIYAVDFDVEAYKMKQ